MRRGLVLYTFGNAIPASGQREIHVCYYGLVPTVAIPANTSGEAAPLAWLDAAELRHLPDLQRRIVDYPASAATLTFVINPEGAVVGRYAASGHVHGFVAVPVTSN